MKNAAGGRPLLLTESSWYYDSNISAADQPAFATAWVKAVQNAGIVGIWWAWQTSGQASDTDGTLWNGYALNPAGVAFQAAIQ